MGEDNVIELSPDREPKRPSDPERVLDADSIRLPHIGDPVHVHMPHADGTESCGFGWITSYPSPRKAGSTVAVLGIAPPPGGTWQSPQIFHNPHPSPIIMPGVDPMGTWHWPRQCPWER